MKWLIQLTKKFVFLSMPSDKVTQTKVLLTYAKYHHSQAIPDCLSLPLCQKLPSCQIC